MGKVNVQSGQLGLTSELQSLTLRGTSSLDVLWVHSAVPTVIPFRDVLRVGVCV